MDGPQKSLEVTPHPTSSVGHPLPSEREYTFGALESPLPGSLLCTLAAYRHTHHALDAGRFGRSRIYGSTFFRM